jgi:hypothetical protein
MSRTASSSSSFVEPLESRQLFAAPQATSVFADNRGEVQITFNQALDPTTVNTRTVFVHLAGADDTFGTADDAKITGRVKLTAGGKRIWYRPAEKVPFAAGSSYSIKVSGKLVKSATGRPHRRGVQRPRHCDRQRHGGRRLPRALQARQGAQPHRPLQHHRRQLRRPHVRRQDAGQRRQLSRLRQRRLLRQHVQPAQPAGVHLADRRFHRLADEHGRAGDGQGRAANEPSPTTATRGTISLARPDDGNPTPTTRARISSSSIS